MAENDPKGERGGDTGNTDQKGKGPQAEKGDQRREPQAGGNAQSHAQEGKSEHDKRSEAGSNTNQ